MIREASSRVPRLERRIAQAWRGGAARAQAMRGSSSRRAPRAGMQLAIPQVMAAVMALVFLFVLASVTLMVKVTAGGLSFVSAFAMACFAALAIGVFLGTFLQARRWEDEH
jgi:hypothetical protein